MSTKASFFTGILAFGFISFFGSALADEASWQFEADGISYELDRTGEIIRLYSKSSQPVSVPDRRGIRNAQIVAEERAKARIVRFIEEAVSDQTIIEELENEMQAAVAAQSGGAGAPQLSSEAFRTTSRSIRQITRSQAEGNLRGVVRLEDGYDAELGEAWVTVGASRTSMRAASAVGSFVSGDNESAEDVNEHGDDEGSGTNVKSERRGSRMKDF